MERKNNKNNNKNNNIRKFSNTKKNNIESIKKTTINTQNTQARNSRNRLNEPIKRLNSKYEANIREERIRRNTTNASNRNKTRTSTKTKKQRNNAKIARIFTFFIFFLIISYFGFSIYKSLTKKPITYETINYGTIDNQKTAKGVIIRDETVYKAGRNGSLGFYKSGNERVKKGEIIASIKDETAIQNTEQELEEINKRILEIQENREELSLFSEDVKRVDLQIQSILENGVYEFAKNDMSSIYKIKDNVQKKLDIRNQMLLSETSGSISELASQKNAKEQLINSNTENISIKESGILSYYVDGLEETFNIDNLDNITKEQTKMQAEKQDELLNYKIQVLQGDTVFKIVESNEFYIASYIKTEYLNNWKEGDLKSIYISDEGKYEPLEVRIEKIVPEEKESYVLMKCTKNIIDFIDKRSITFEINKPKEGFKISNTAIAEKNFLKVPLDYIVDNTITKKVNNETIKINLENIEINELEKVAYVPIKYGELNIGDTVINTTTNKEFIIKDTLTIKGIYIVNSGIYEFAKINLENSVSNQDFTILDPNINTNIRIYDRFIPDAKAVLKEEPIYN